MENELMIDPVKFTNDGKTYVYDKNEIGFWQIELARETLEFHASALENHAPNFQTALQSDIFDWQIIIMAYLLKKEDENGNLVKFDRGKSESEIKEFVRYLPMSQYEKMKECVTDFFTSIGMRSKLLLMYQRKKPMSALDLINGLSSLEATA